MEIHSLKINHVETPLGYLYQTLSASYVIDGKEGEGDVESARICVAVDAECNQVVYDTGRGREVNGLETPLAVVMKPQTRYYWFVEVWDTKGESHKSEISWFETGLLEKGFCGEWITPSIPPDVAPVFIKTFPLKKKAKNARLYLCCLGVYEAFLNSQRIGQEWLTPGLTVYEKYVQYQTYDVGSLLREGENTLEVVAGDGWYKGLYGYRQNADYRKGKIFELIGDLYVDGDLLLSSDTSWEVKKNKITESDMYDGEVFDSLLDDSERFSVVKGSLSKDILGERLGVPVKVMETIYPVEMIHTPKGETVLDMGQNMVGRVAFTCREKAGRRLLLEHGEVMQDGCFFNKNYRTAKARYEYVSDGEEREVTPRLCFFGFRYIRLQGFSQVNLEDFKGEVLYSELPETGTMQTGNEMINQLIRNILWSQKGNFLDIPTDCPQRDEKMGWTGDAQIFAGTASLNMECYAFFRKYLHDIALEQEETKGLVPQIVPSVGRNERTSAAWGDAAVIIPRKLYTYYGDSSILKEQYESMKGWIAYIDAQNEEHHTNPKLWQNGFHYGDWLALDGGCYHMPTGGTDVFYISSAYYYYSVKLMTETAKVLKNAKDTAYFEEKAEGIRQEILNEYFTANGKLSIDTQSAYIVAIVFGIVKEKEQKKQLWDNFLLRIRKDGYSLKTGFVGTPFILTALSECGRDDMAYRLLLSPQYPGWLYPVTLGATTMWERWDALNPDGSMSDSGMNSLNHYANGAIQEWMYQYMAGLKPVKAGFAAVEIAPRIHPEISWLTMNRKTPAGTYRIHWEIRENDQFYLKAEIPFGAKAKMILPYPSGSIWVNGREMGHVEEWEARTWGTYEFQYILDSSYIPYYHLTDSVRELVREPKIKEYLYEKAPMLRHTDGEEIQNMTLYEMSKLPFFLGIGTRLGLEEPVLKEMEAFVSRFPKEICESAPIAEW